MVGAELTAVIGVSACIPAAVTGGAVLRKRWQNKKDGKVKMNGGLPPRVSRAETRTKEPHADNTWILSSLYHATNVAPTATTHNNSA